MPALQPLGELEAEERAVAVAENREGEVGPAPHGRQQVVDQRLQLGGGLLGEAGPAPGQLERPYQLLNPIIRRLETAQARD